MTAALLRVICGRAIWGLVIRERVLCFVGATAPVALPRTFTVVPVSRLVCSVDARTSLGLSFEGTDLVFPNRWRNVTLR